MAKKKLKKIKSVVKKSEEKARETGSRLKKAESGSDFDLADCRILISKRIWDVVNLPDQVYIPSATKILFTLSLVLVKISYGMV